MERDNQDKHTEKVKSPAAEIKPEVLDALRQEAKDGRITCPAARKLADELQVPTRAIGDAADTLKIKIISCGLGCF